MKALVGGLRIYNINFNQQLNARKKVNGIFLGEAQENTSQLQKKYYRRNIYSPPAPGGERTDCVGAERGTCHIEQERAKPVCVEISLRRS